MSTFTFYVSALEAVQLRILGLYKKGGKFMQLEGSCHCQKVRFSVFSAHPYPYNLCYCSICRKTAGGGYAINLGAEYDTLKVEGEEHLGKYMAKTPDVDTGELKQSPMERYFCQLCGSALWAWDPRWPELVHPMASAIDTSLPIPPERVHLMLEFKADWVMPQVGAKDQCFEHYPAESIAQWHARLGLVSDKK